MKFKSYKKKKIGSRFSFIIIITIISIILSILIIHNYSIKVDKIIKPLAVSKVKEYITKTINSSTLGVDFNKDIIEIEKENNVIKMINYNTNEVIKLLDTITFNIQNKLSSLEKEDNDYIIDYIKFGIIFDSTLLRNIGPKIKIKLEPLEDVITNIETEVKPYGINNAYIEMRVYIEVTGKVVLPFTTEEVKVSNVIPISMYVINGEVPSGYIASYK